MRRLLLSLFIVVSVGACQTSGQLSSGVKDTHTILVMSEENADGSIPHGNRINHRVLNEMSAMLNHHGFSVFDETAVTFNRHSGAWRSNREAEIIRIAQSVDKPPIDTIALFTVHMDRRLQPVAHRTKVRVSARLLDAQSGRRLGHAEVSEQVRTRPDCRGPCYVETIGDVARVMGRELAAILADRLNFRPLPVRKLPVSDGLKRGVTLTFDNFSVVEMQDIQDYLASFSGYRNHRPINSFHRRVEIWYETSISPVKLRRKLDRMFDALGIEARIAFQGNTYSIRQVRVPLQARRKAPAYRW